MMGKGAECSAHYFSFLFSFEKCFFHGMSMMESKIQFIFTLVRHFICSDTICRIVVVFIVHCVQPNPAQSKGNDTIIRRLLPNVLFVGIHLPENRLHMRRRRCYFGIDNFRLRRCPHRIEGFDLRHTLPFRTGNGGVYTRVIHLFLRSAIGFVHSTKYFIGIVFGHSRKLNSHLWGLCSSGTVDVGRFFSHLIRLHLPTYRLLTNDSIENAVHTRYGTRDDGENDDCNTHNRNSDGTQRFPIFAQYSGVFLGDSMVHTSNRINSGCNNNYMNSISYNLHVHSSTHTHHTVLHSTFQSIAWIVESEHITHREKLCTNRIGFALVRDDRIDTVRKSWPPFYTCVSRART